MSDDDTTGPESPNDESTIDEPLVADDESRPTKWATARVWLVDIVVGGVLAALVVVGVNWWNDRDDDSTSIDASDGSTQPDVTSSPSQPVNTVPRTTLPLKDVEIDPAKTYTATVKTSQGTIVIELDTKNAPIAAGQFVKLAQAGFYDGLTFHRVVDNFVIQGGDPSGNGSGGSGTSVQGEVPSDNYPIGSLAAAKSAADPAGTFDSQFFIVTGANGETLPNEYARFGIVTKGLDVAIAIEDLATPGTETTSETVQIESVEITES